MVHDLAPCRWRISPLDVNAIPNAGDSTLSGSRRGSPGSRTPTPSRRPQPVRFRRRARPALPRPGIQVRPAIPHPVAAPVEDRTAAASPATVSSPFKTDPGLVKDSLVIGAVDPRVPESRSNQPSTSGPSGTDATGCPPRPARIRPKRCARWVSASRIKKTIRR